jgi:hypothetical protein
MACPYLLVRLPAIVATATAAAAVAVTVTAATTAAAATAAATAAAAATTTTAILGLIHPDRPAVQLAAIHLLDGRLGVSRGLEGHEPEPPGAPGVAIGDHFGLYDGSKSLECGPQAGIGSIPAETAYKDLIRHATDFLLLRRRRFLTKGDESPDDQKLPTIARAGCHR